MEFNQQLLPIQTEEKINFEHYFVSAQNAGVVNYLQNMPRESQAEKMIYLTGKTGCGLTHLLQACAGNYEHVFYLSFKDFQQPPMDSRDSRDFRETTCQLKKLTKLKELENLYTENKRVDFIALDDIDCLALLPEIENTEKMLFNLYNHLFYQAAHPTVLMIAGHCLPGELKCLLPDLKSRLQSFLVLTVNELTDEEKITALEKRAHHRGFRLPREVSQYLLTHYPRNLNYLFDSLNKLDKLSLEEKRMLTVPFVKKVLF